jgi:hypothetical protein
MTLTRTHAALAALAVVAFVAALAVGRSAFQAEPTPDDAAAAARTSFPDLEAASAEPQLPGLTALQPRPGEVLQAPGRFDDRFVLSDLHFDGGTLSGAAQITSDVSDVLEFEALAGFYDEQGLLVGTGRFVHHLAEGHDHERADHVGDDGGHAGPPSEHEAFSIPVPAEAAGRAVSAAVGVPVLVNE